MLSLVSTFMHTFINVFSYHDGSAAEHSYLATSPISIPEVTKYIAFEASTIICRGEDVFKNFLSLIYCHYFAARLFTLKLTRPFP